MPRTTIRTEDIADSEVTTAKMATDPTNASNLSSGSVPLAQLGNAPEYDDSGLQDDIALIGFKVASNGSLAKYDLVDQTVDDFQSEAGIDTSASTDEVYDSTSKYYSGAVVGSYSIDAFTSTGAATWTCPSNTTEAEILVVAGGGGGGAVNPMSGNAGGGGGGVVHAEAYPVTAAVVYDLTVGAGGATLTAGSDSVFNINGEGSNTTVLTGNGGGYGAARTPQGPAAGSGGSGGGGSGGDLNNGGGSATQPASFGTPQVAVGYGNDGGTGAAGGGAATENGAGGGGAGAGGGLISTPARQNGGAGKLFSNFGAYGTDASNSTAPATGKGYFAGGGGGTYGTGPRGTGGVGGGAQGALNSPEDGVPGLANTGGGGGSARGTTSTAGTGGSGIALIRHRSLAYNNMTLISNSTTAEATPTKGDMVMTYTDGAGTNVINTDIKAYVSRDNGTTYTQGTLVDQGTSGGHTILSFHNLDIASQPSGTAMRYKIETLNQSVSKYANIQAVSLGWS